MGLIVVCGRLPLMVAPAATLRWVKALIETNTRLRILGVIALLVATGMIWAGGAEDSILASVLTIWGWAIVAMSTSLLMIFPGVYRKIASAFLPAAGDESLPGWRLIGGLGTMIGLLLIYSGVLAL